MSFFKNFFLSTGVIWTFSALAILIFNLNFGPQEIIISLIFPLAYAVVRLFDKSTQPTKIGE